MATTTKQVDWEQAHWTPIRVGAFEREQSITMLLGRTGQSDQDAANTIADALGDLPVAVSQAAATIKRSRCGLATYATYLDRLRKYSLEDSVRHLDGDEYPAAVGAALKLAVRTALKEVGKQSPRWEEIASRQLGVLALLAASGVPRRWLEGTDQDSSDRSSLDASEALSSLVEFSVCQLSEDGAKVALPRLQSRVIRENWKSERKDRARAEEDAVALLASVNAERVRNRENSNRRQDAIDLADQLRAISEQDYSNALFSSPLFGKVLASALWYSAELGAPQAAIALSDAVTHLGKILGPDHADTLTSRNNLAYAYQGAGRLDQAITLYEETLADSARVLGDDHPDTLASRNNLASAYESAGRLDQAITLYEKTLADSARVLGDDHPQTLTSRHNLAYSYKAAGRLDQAITLYEKTLADRVRVLGDDHPDTLTSRYNLAYAYLAAGRVEELLALFDPPNDPGSAGE